MPGEKNVLQSDHEKPLNKDQVKPVQHSQSAKVRQHQDTLAQHEQALHAQHDQGAKTHHEQDSQTKPEQAAPLQHGQGITVEHEQAEQAQDEQSGQAQHEQAAKVQQKRTIKSLVNTPLKRVMFGIQILSYVLIVGSPAIGGLIGKMLELKTGATAGVIFGIFIAGEILFYGSLAFLGKELILLLKERMGGLFRRKR
jgi:cation transport ATPase